MAASCLRLESWVAPKDLGHVTLESQARLSVQDSRKQNESVQAKREQDLLIRDIALLCTQNQRTGVPRTRWHTPPSSIPATLRSLDHLMMSHNNVGRRGAKAVFMALRQRARDGVEILVDLQSCELGSDTGDDLFDMYSPSGRCARNTTDQGCAFCLHHCRARGIRAPSLVVPPSSVPRA